MSWDKSIKWLNVRKGKHSNGSRKSESWRWKELNNKTGIKTISCYHSSQIKRLKVPMIASNSPKGVLFVNLVAYTITKHVHSDLLAIIVLGI